MIELLLLQLHEVHYNHGVQQSTEGTAWWNTWYLQLSTQLSQCTSTAWYSRIGGTRIVHYCIQLLC